MATPRRTIKVPLEFVEAIDRVIEKSKGFYRSRPEVTSVALKKFLRGKIKREEKEISVSLF